MKTSYYSSKKFRVEDAVSISRGTPKWFNGAKAVELMPTWEMIKRNYGYDEYIKYLNKNNVKAEDVYKKYKDKTLLCYEKNYLDCHRSYIAKWLKKELNIDVIEIGQEQIKLFKNEPEKGSCLEDGYETMGVTPLKI